MLTKEEREAVARMLADDTGWRGTLFEYGVYILPTLLFAGYGMMKQDWIAALVAYVSLLLVAVMYLSYGKSFSTPLRSALRKYEESVGALSARSSGSE